MSLDEALRHARTNRPSIAAAQQRVVSADLSRRALGAFPATRLFVGYTDPFGVGGSDDDLVLAQPLDVFGRTSAARATGDALVLRSRAELRSTLSALQFDVVTQYADAATAKALAESATQSQDIAQKLYDAIKSLVDEGKLSGVQLTRVGIELERAKLAASQKNAELRASLKRLAGLVNLPGEQVSIADFPQFNVQRVGEGAALDRPDLQLLAADVKSAEAEARVASLGQMPELEIQGRRTPWQESEPRLGLRLQLSIPLMDFGKTRSETRAARLVADSARKALEDAKRVATGEIKAALIEMEAASEGVQRFEAIDKQTHDLVERSRIGFTEKAVTLVELLEATRALREVEEGKAEASSRLVKAQAEYLRATGQLLEAAK
ncbi:MAG: TolC family protein [Armatimonadetes bacterium]|nr:TolC family protein [Armatimonadota bacterium]